MKGSFIEYATEQEERESIKRESKHDLLSGQDDLVSISQTSINLDQLDVLTASAPPSRPETPIDLSMQLDSLESSAQSIAQTPLVYQRNHNGEDPQSIYPGYVKVRPSVHYFDIAIERELQEKRRPFGLSATIHQASNRSKTVDCHLSQFSKNIDDQGLEDGS
jgi:hypothetical protein